MRIGLAWVGALIILVSPLTVAAFELEELGSLEWAGSDGEAPVGPRENEPTRACLRPYPTTSNQTAAQWLRPFFGGTNTERNNGCQFVGQPIKTVCVPMAFQTQVNEANRQAAEWYSCCPAPKAPFAAPFTNRCRCSCTTFSASYCWDGAGLKTFELAR